jgi:hypothetical protein
MTYLEHEQLCLANCITFPFSDSCRYRKPKSEIHTELQRCGEESVLLCGWTTTSVRVVQTMESARTALWRAHRVLAYCKPEDGASSLQYPTQDPQMGIGGPAGIASHHKEETRAPWLPKIFGRTQARASPEPKQRHGRQQGIAAADQRRS